MKPKLYTWRDGKKVQIKLRKVGTVTFTCPNCGKTHNRVLWEHVDDPDDDLYTPLIATYAQCRCGASLMCADNMESFGVYWLNEKEVLGETENKEASGS